MRRRLLLEDAIREQHVVDALLQRRELILADEFPMTITGKIQKYLMREQSIEELSLGETAQERHA